MFPSLEAISQNFGAKDPKVRSPWQLSPLNQIPVISCHDISVLKGKAFELPGTALVDLDLRVNIKSRELVDQRCRKAAAVNSTFCVPLRVPAELANKVESKDAAFGGAALLLLHVSA